MRQPLLACLVLLLFADIGNAGAWPREEGRFFISVSQNISHFATGVPDGYRSVYLEYGLTPKLTFGAKLWRRADGQYGDIYAFLAHPVGPTDRANKFSVSLGFGARRFGDGRIRPILLPHFAWGRGFDTPFMPGWMSLDIYAGAVGGANDGFFKTDFTFGLKPDRKTHLILQLRAYDDPLGSVAIIAPTYVRQISDTTKLELGLTYRLQERNRLGVIFGTWIEF